MSVSQLSIEQHELDNGLRVVVSEDHLTPAVAVNLWYGVGSRHESEGRTGLAHLFEHLMFQGSANVGPNEHFSAIQGVGGVLNGTTNFDRTNYFETVPSQAFELALWLEADRMGGLLAALTQTNLDNQRDVVKNERRQRYDNPPYGTAAERLFAMAFPPGHPYHHVPIGSMADLDAASLEECATFFRTYYTPDNAVLSIVGDIEGEAAMAAVKRYFAEIPSGAGTPPAPDGTIGAMAGEVRDVVHEDVPAEAVYLMYRLPPDGDPAVDAAELATVALVGGPASRLERRLVRTEQLAQAVNAGVTGLVGGSSVLMVVANARSGVSLDALMDALDDELAHLADSGPTEAELARAKAKSERQWLDQMATLGQRADALSGQATLFGNAERINQRLAALNTVTVDGVREACAERVVPTNRAAIEYRLDRATGSNS